MKKTRCDKASNGYTFIKAFGKTILVLLILAGISSSNNVSILDKSDAAIQAYDKATEI